MNTKNTKNTRNTRNTRNTKSIKTSNSIKSIKSSNSINNIKSIKSIKSVKKKKKKNNMIFVFLDILLIIILVLFIHKIITNNNKKDNIDNDTEVIKNPSTRKEKLDMLGNINKKISFFDMNILDRYVSYKQENPKMDNEKVIVYVNIGLDKEFYSDIKDSPDKHKNTVLVNKYNYLGKDYVPNNLVEINSDYSSGKKLMVKEAAEAFEEMARDAKKKGYNIRAISTYRSYSYQLNLYNNYASKDGKEKADTYSARAGYSEHQTGLAVDVDNTKVSYTSFGSTKEFGWMKDNAYKYGFILRYTKETESITGYMNEPWHYRYVGKDIAKYIYNNPMTYEEYYVRFLEK